MAAKGWRKSKVTKESLIPYVAAGIIPEFKRERWRVPAANEVEPLPRPVEFVLFLSFLDRGLALPTSDFFRQLLSFYNIKVSDLGPHIVQQIALFVALCECYLGCPPYFPLWVSIFHGRANRTSKSDRSLIPNGGITFQVKSGENFIDMALPKKAQSQWRRFWFYALEYTPAGGVPIPQYTPEPSAARRLNVRSLPEDQEEVVKGMRQTIQALKDSSLTAANMYNCWLGRRLVPLRCRAHLMWEYKGQNDLTRSTATEWDEAEYRNALAKVTTATFTSFDDGLQPFSEDKPAPHRWQTVANHLPPLVGKEPPEMTKGEDDEVEDEGDRTDRGTASSSQSAPGESAQEDDEGEESTSLPEGKGPVKKDGELQPKRLRQTILEGAIELRRPLKDAVEAGARVGPGVKAIPTVKSKKKVLTRPAPAAGAAATRAAEAKKAAELKKAAEVKKAAADPADLTSTREEIVAESQAMGATASSAEPVDGSYPWASASRAEAVKASATPDTAQDPVVVPQAQERALGEAREGYAKEFYYREADFRAQQAEDAKKKAKAEVADLTKVLEDKGKELEDVIADYKARLDTVAEARDAARGAAAMLREEPAALKLQHAKELAAEKEASEGTVLAVQAEKTSFKAFVREMSRQLLVGRRSESIAGVRPLSVASLLRGSSPRAWRVRFGDPVPERGESASGSITAWRVRFGDPSATPRECLQEAATRISACAGEILAALQYLSPREVIPRDAPSVFKAVSDIPAVVDWLRRSSCRVGVTMALSMVLAHYSEGFDVEEVTAGFPSETGEFDVAEVLRLMETVRPYADRVLATADLETHIASQSAPEDAEKAPGPQDFPAERLFHAAATNALSTYPVVRYIPKFRHGEGGAEPVVEGEPSSSK
ncbi:hypothetical protein QYE76_063121 [Lolium multiflorum]|uniref:Transposase (putative) gypsy type domain-containing protein n=1 Tax=Lolium multiflorum TaxID=4521 RepID=A0AAD8W693_LOLMU|nr:hypothetical protein QYE76_063121 [Lolium multiflorum]